jgi:hypothetical protein
MNIVRRQRGQVLVILVGTLFLGGAGLAAGVMSSGSTLKQLKKDIKALELTDAREDQALDVLKRWNKAVKPVAKEHRKHAKELLKMMKEQLTTADALAAEFAAQNNNTLDAGVQVAALRDELRAILSKSEWDRVFAPK